jgi:hypothetical protein
VAPDPPEPQPTPDASTEPANASPLRARIAELEAEVAQLRAATGGAEAIELDDERVLQEVGIYRYHHPLENAAEYKQQLTELSDEIKDMVRAKEAVLASDMFTYNNSLVQGRRMTSDSRSSCSAPTTPRRTTACAYCGRGTS